MPTGIAPSDIAVGDVNGDGLPDIIVSDQASGDVTVLLNDPTHSFSQSLRFRASTGFYGLSTTSAGPAVSSFAQTVSLVAGDFTGHRRRRYRGRQSRRRTASPSWPATATAASPTRRSALTTSTSDGWSINDRPGAIVAGDFNRDGKLDLAVLMEDTGEIWIYSGNGNGTFRHTFSIPVGDEATGLIGGAGSGPGSVDLLVGNGFGDVLILEGKGDGTFQIQGSRVSLSVVPNLLGPGQAGRAGRRPAEQPRDGAGAVRQRQPVLAGADAGHQLVFVCADWRPATCSGRSSTRGRRCPTPSW